MLCLDEGLRGTLKASGRGFVKQSSKDETPGQNQLQRAGKDLQCTLGTGLGFSV